MTSGDHDPKPIIGNGLTYRAAGVDMAAADALVETVKPLAQATHRRGVMGGPGGFGALFDPKAAGFCDPALGSGASGGGPDASHCVAANDAQVLEIAGTKIVGYGQAGVGLFFLQGRDQVRADEAGAAGDEEIEVFGVHNVEFRGA